MVSGCVCCFGTDWSSVSSTLRLLCACAQCSVLKKYEPVQNISTPASNSVTLRLLYACAAIHWGLKFVFPLFHFYMPVIVCHLEKSVQLMKRGGSLWPQACNLYHELACINVKPLSTSGQLESLFFPYVSVCLLILIILLVTRLQLPCPPPSACLDRLRCLWTLQVKGNNE